MILATGAKLRMLASKWSYFSALSLLEEQGRAASGDSGVDSWDMDE